MFLPEKQSVPDTAALLPRCTRFMVIRTVGGEFSCDR